MHLHVIGICGTFMGGIDALARTAGHRVTGCDQNVYPPMSEQLAALGIELIQGYDPAQLELDPDMVLVGNVMSRGNPLIEALLDSGLAYTSGPQWLAEHVLKGRRVIAVAGTHGKTTTSSLLAWLLEQAGREPGFLVGGVPADFGVTARLGSGSPFVLEADEYDTAFFDKRAKFVHYRPGIAILHNLEHDHADIYPDVAAIRWQFHQLLRTVPRSGRVLANAAAPEIDTVLAMGCWTPVLRYAVGAVAAAQWRALVPEGGDGSRFSVWHGPANVAEVEWGLLGRHNVDNALAAVVAAAELGVPPEVWAGALARFSGVRRRLEIRGVVDGVTVYDDFAHHPTAIAATVEALRRRIGAARLVAILEPRSNTMKLGAHSARLAPALSAADLVRVYAPPGLGWNVAAVLTALGSRLEILASIEALVETLARELQPGDHALIMSNGGFGGLHGRLLDALRLRCEAGAAG